MRGKIREFGGGRLGIRGECVFEKLSELSGEKLLS